MKTKILVQSDISEAATLLQEGQLIGLPTETVYGLAANGLDPDAVSKIFLAKGRPSDNPLILHLGDTSWLPRFCKNIPDSALLLGKTFWPGPLTLILECQEIIPNIVTAGLPSVGVRCPNHPLALELLKNANLPLAAPSGNLSGKPSPTSAIAMLEDMNGKIPGILDGGTCSIGVESTILDLRKSPTLLRFGGISVEELESVLQEKITIDPSLLKNCETTSLNHENFSPLAPGMKYRHYAPNAPVTVVIGENSAQWILKQAKTGDGVLCFEEYQWLFPHCVTEIVGKENHFTSQAQRVFSALRAFDKTEVQRIWSQCPKEEGLGCAVANRLQKASGFKVIRLEEEP